MDKRKQRCKAPWRRFRVTVLSKTPEIVLRQDITGGGVPEVHGVISTLKESDNTSVMADVVTPCFKEKQAKGQIINNPMTKSSLVITDEPGSYTITESYPGKVPAVAPRIHIIGETCPRFSPWFNENRILPDPSRRDVAMGASASQAYANAYSLSKADMITELAEIHDTLLMLRRPLTSAYQLARESLYVIRHERGHVQDVRFQRILKESPGVLAGSYLEVRFGWGPLLGSIEDTLAAFKALQERKGRSRRTTRGFSTYEETHQADKTWMADLCTNHQIKEDYSVNIKETRKVEIRSGVLTDVNWVSAIRQSFGLTAWDVIPAAWDLIPLSFVVDRFLHVGDWLNYQARRLNPNVKVLSSWSTETVKTVTEMGYTIHPLDVNCPPAQKYRLQRTGVTTKSFVDRETVTRTPGLNPPSLPVLEVPDTTSLIHTLDYLALGFQSLSYKLSRLRRS